MSSHDVEGKRSDKTDFAERLGAMNRRWQILQGLIAEKVTHESPRVNNYTLSHSFGLQSLMLFYFVVLF